MKLSWAVLVDVGTVCKVFMCNRHMQIVTTKDSNSDVKCHLVHFDSLADTVNVEKEEAVVKQCVRISVMFTAELFSAHVTPRRSSLHANLYRQNTMCSCHWSSWHLSSATATTTQLSSRSSSRNHSLNHISYVTMHATNWTQTMYLTLTQCTVQKHQPQSRTRWLYCVECPQYSTRRRSTSNIHRSSMLRKNR